jgi:hypothetical protein
MSKQGSTGLTKGRVTMDRSPAKGDDAKDQEPDSLAKVTDDEKEDKLMSKTSLHNGEPSAHDRGGDEAD